MRRQKIFGLIFVILGALLTLGPTVIAPTCAPMENGKFMKCHWLGQAVIGAGSAIMLMGIIFFFIKERMMARGVVFCNIVIGIMTLFLPFKLVGACKSPEMPCNVHTVPFIYLVAGLYTLVSIYYSIKEK